MDTAITVALIGLGGSVLGVAGSVIVAFLNHRLGGTVEVQKKQIAKLYALSMSDNMFNHLKKLSTGAYGPYWVDENRQFGLAAELNYLKMLGYIAFDQDPKVPDLRELPAGDNPDLSRYITVTPLGLDFIALREKVPKSA